VDEELDPSSVDVRRIFLIILAFVSGVVAAFASRTTWVEVTFVNYRVIDDWYGQAIFFSGIGLALSALIPLAEVLDMSIRKWAQLLGVAIGLFGFIASLVVGIRVRQIASDIASRSRAPERWLEGTILEGLGKLLANASESIASVAEPQLTSNWKITTAALGVGAIALGFLVPWRGFNLPFSPAEQSEDSDE
jgi:hypothetical protein